MTNKSTFDLINHPEVIEKRREIIWRKLYLKNIYHEWYSELISPIKNGEILELGSGVGFLKNLIPNLISSDILELKKIDLVLDGQNLPFKAESLDSIILNNVLHHIPDPRQFFREASRCLKFGGIISMNEPWITPWSKFIFQYFHHEESDPKALSWSFDSQGPLSSANEANPWIMFERDKNIFTQAFPEFHIISIRPHTPFSYLLSGGFTFPSLLPSWTYNIFQSIEKRMKPFYKQTAMFAYIALKKVG